MSFASSRCVPPPLRKAGYSVLNFASVTCLVGLGWVWTLVGCTDDFQAREGNLDQAIDYSTACVHMPRNPSLQIDASFELWWRTAACRAGRWLDPNLCASSESGPSRVCASTYAAEWANVGTRRVLEQKIVSQLQGLGGYDGSDIASLDLHHRVYTFTARLPKRPPVKLDRVDYVSSPTFPANVCFRDNAGRLQFNDPPPETNRKLKNQFAQIGMTFRQESSPTPSYNCHGYVLNALESSIPLHAISTLQPMFDQKQSDQKTFDFDALEGDDVEAQIWAMVDALKADVKDRDVLAFYGYTPRGDCSTPELTHSAIVRRPAGAEPEVVSKHREGPVLAHDVEAIVPLMSVYGFTVVRYRLWP